MGEVVALLAEGVDRNICTRSEYFYDKVALLAEGVDRNASTFSGERHNPRSPSSRRAWIEIEKLKARI